MLRLRARDRWNLVLRYIPPYITHFIDQFENSTGNEVIVSYGASNALAKQIEALWTGPIDRVEFEPG